MLPQKNNVAPLRNRIIVKVAESFINNRFDDADNIPAEIMPDGTRPYHASLEVDRNIIRQLVLAIMGFSPDDEKNSTLSLKEYGKKALQREKLLPSKLSVITDACAACMKQQHVVTNFCRGCIARPCQVNCPKGAISFTEANRAQINPELCINCGICMNSCPYNAIIKVPVPCEDSCPVGAITKDENGKEHIDNSLCISCGKCLRSCPFGAIVEPYQIIDVLKLLKDSNKKVAAMLAPAVLGQFSGSINNLIGAMKKLGFDSVFEVAVGADITTEKEAAEFLEYPGTIWMFSPQSKLVPVPSAHSQYRKARKQLIKYNQALNEGSIVFYRNPKDLAYFLRRMKAQLHKTTLQLETQIREESSSWYDNQADNVFYQARGLAYADYMLLKALSFDYKQILVDTNTYSDWTILLKTLESAAQLSPSIVRNGKTDSLTAPNHLSNIGFYLYKAQNLLQKLAQQLGNNQH